MVQMFFRPAADTQKVRLPAALTAVISISIVATILFGVAPNIAFDFLQGNFNQFTDFFQ
jgi:NADH-quinone oxidoreductase subunit N